MDRECRRNIAGEFSRHRDRADRMRGDPEPIAISPQFYRGQSDLAAARARAQSGAAWYRAVTGTDPPKHRTTSSEIKFATLHRSANGRSGPLVLEDNGAIRFFDV